MTCLQKPAQLTESQELLRKASRQKTIQTNLKILGRLCCVSGAPYKLNQAQKVSRYSDNGVYLRGFVFGALDKVEPGEQGLRCKAAGR